MQTGNPKCIRDYWLMQKKGQRKVLSEELSFRTKKKMHRKLNR